jgi:ferritin
MALIPQKVIAKLQYRINQEEQSSRIYKAMSVWLNLNGFKGAAKLWQKYSDEELKHAEWAYERLLDLNILPVVNNIDRPQSEFKGLANVIALSYAHEVDITRQCQELTQVCMDEGDFMDMELAQRYCKEQAEELAKTQSWIDKLTAFGEDKIALRLLDNEMGE